MLIEKENPKVLEICDIFDNPSAIQEYIGKAGIRLFTVMYGMVCLLCFFLRVFNAFQTHVSAYSRKRCKNFWFSVSSGCLEKEFHLPGMV